MSEVQILSPRPYCTSCDPLALHRCLVNWLRAEKHLKWEPSCLDHEALNWERISTSPFSLSLGMHLLLHQLFSL